MPLPERLSGFHPKVLTDKALQSYLNGIEPANEAGAYLMAEEIMRLRKELRDTQTLSAEAMASFQDGLDRSAIETRLWRRLFEATIESRMLSIIRKVASFFRSRRSRK